MTPKEIAEEIYDNYNKLNDDNQFFEAKEFAYKVLHSMALAYDMSYKEYYDITEEIEKL